MSYDICCDEEADAGAWRRAEDRARLHGVPFDPVLEGVMQPEDECDE